MAILSNGVVQYFVGDQADVLVSFVDRLGRFVDPGSLSILVNDPNNVTTTYNFPSSAVVKNATGQYEAFFALTSPSSSIRNWTYRWVGTGANQCVAEGSIIVQTPGF